MVAQDVKIGEVYEIGIGNRITRVRITGLSRKGGWEGESEKSGRPIRIKSAGRLKTLETAENEIRENEKVIAEAVFRETRTLPNTAVTEQTAHCCGCGKPMDTRSKWYCADDCKQAARTLGIRYCWNCGKQIEKGMTCIDCGK